MPYRGGGIRLGGKTMLLVLVVGVILGQDPLQLLSMLSGMGDVGGPPVTSRPSGGTKSLANDEDADFVSVVLADTEDTWQSILPQIGLQYQAPHLVMFSDQVSSACGFSSAATGPFYCPGDRKVYIDLSFFHTLSQLGAPGDFARAYVVGHEVGHHIQNLMGLSDKVHRMQQQVGGAEANALSVRLELQADCFAGVWAHHANKQRQLLEPGDVEEGLQAAASIGDDKLMKQAGRRVAPESFTHGSAEQRVNWLNKGLQSGDINACNTFAS
jgi:uncharacterized protein